MMYKVITPEDETRFRAKVYISCLNLIKGTFMFYNNEIITKEHFDKNIEGLKKVFQDMLQQDWDDDHLKKIDKKEGKKNGNE